MHLTFSGNHPVQSGNILVDNNKAALHLDYVSSFFAFKSYWILHLFFPFSPRTMADEKEYNEQLLLLNLFIIEQLPPTPGAKKGTENAISPPVP